MANEERSTVVGSTPQGGAVRKVLAAGGFSFGVIHKEQAQKRGSGRPTGTIKGEYGEDGMPVAYTIHTPVFSPVEGELGTLSASGDTRTLSASGGYIKDDNGENIVVFDAQDTALGQLKWHAMVSLIPMDTINKRKAEAKKRAQDKKAAAK